jgi:ubiquinone/menaquinone biosynthesis C-methylase UbiE
VDHLLAQLRACADPSRLRLLALCTRGAFCVSELTAILGQSQPRLSRHLKLLVEAGLLECSREGAHAWFSRTPDRLADQLMTRLPEHDPDLAADARAAARMLSDRARAASDQFRNQGADWDEMRALELPATLVEQALMAMLPQAQDGAGLGDVLDLGTGTGRLLELVAPCAAHCLGIDANPAMLALARNRLSRTELGHCRVRQADAYRLPLPAARFDVVLAQMLLHHAEDPAAILAEARRVLRPGGTLLVIDLEADPDLARHNFRWPGFANPQMRALLTQAGLSPRAGAAIPGPATVRLWPARAPIHAERLPQPSPPPMELSP